LENTLAGQIQPALGDCRNLLTGEYDRVVMGHFDAIHMLPDIISYVHPGSVIHLHSIGTVEAEIKEVVEGAGFSATIEVHTVKNYRPHESHMVQDVTLS
ncbi:MAG: SAM-dependent methyltransferase, partial [Methanoregula sp.]|nr:SAM-dependent methyltransferase [Methanoregula sp.]